MSSSREIKIFVFAILLVSLSVGLELQPALAAPTAGECGNFTGLVACWRMEENGGTKLVDWSGNGLDANILWNFNWDTGKVGKYSWKLNEIPYATVINNSVPSISNAITLAGWFNTVVSSGAYQGIITKPPTSSDGYQLGLIGAPRDGKDRKVYFRLVKQSSSTVYQVLSDFVYPLGNGFPVNPTNWVFVVGTYNGAISGKPMDIYVNGVRQVQNNQPVQGPDTFNADNLGIVLGGLYGQSVTNLFYGDIDEVRIYNRALTADEISTLFEHPTAVNLASFTGSTLGRTVHLTWTTASEEDLVGFNLYRSESASGEAQLVNPSPIPAQNIGQLTGASYQFTDVVDLGQQYFYRLELVKQDGNWPGPQVSMDTRFKVNLPLLIY